MVHAVDKIHINSWIKITFHFILKMANYCYNISLNRLKFLRKQRTYPCSYFLFNCLIDYYDLISYPWHIWMEIFLKKMKLANQQHSLHCLFSSGCTKLRRCQIINKCYHFQRKCECKRQKKHAFVII